MQFTFLDMAGKTLFIRDDAERAQWTQEEMSLELEFPRLDDKVISIGQRVFFIDPSTGAHQIYEVKQAKTLEPDHYQTIIAENICISELSDEHINNSQVTNVTAQAALQSVLTGTQWSIGTVALNPVSSADLSRGSAWQAILQIKDNWNVYIEPRVTLSGNGTITRRLDILSTNGTWNGVRLSVDKNMLDPSVTYDDSEVVTAMYGYGGTTTPTTKEEQEVEIDFSGIAWSKTGDHPAKPMGQKYIEDPAATAAYGRNGRARFGFYQNTDIVDPQLLLQKTWEALKVASKPSISIDGTVADLYRMGYADEPIKLHDIALVEVLPAGYKQQVQIIKITTDLLDPSSTTLTIGSYIPNIVYIERQTNEQATGSRGGGGGNKSKQTPRSEYETALTKNNRMIMLRAYQNDLDDVDNEVKKQEARITVEHDRITQEVTDRREADNVLNASITVTAKAITQEVTRASAAEGELSGRITTTAEAITEEVTRATDAEGELSGRLTVTADAITAEVTRATDAEGVLDGKIVVEAGKITQIVEAVGENGEVTAASIVLAINEAGESVAHIDASKVYIGNQKSTTVIAGKCELSDVTAQYIAGKIATLSVLNVAAISATGNIHTTNGYIMAPYYYLGTTGSTRNLASSIWALQIVQNGDTYTLQAQDYDDTTWVDVGSFSRATTLKGAWSGGRFTASASPQGNTFWTELVQGTSSRDGGTITIPVEAIDQDSGGTQYATGRNVYVTLNTMSITRAPAYKNSGGSYEYYGKLYYYDASASVYRAASNSDHYWYYSNKNRSGTNTVLYD